MVLVLPQAWCYPEGCAPDRVLPQSCPHGVWPCLLATLTVFAAHWFPTLYIRVTWHFRYPASSGSGWSIRNHYANNCPYFEENHDFDIKNAALIHQMVHEGKEALIKQIEMKENSDVPAAVPLP